MRVTIEDVERYFEQHDNAYIATYNTRDELNVMYKAIYNRIIPSYHKTKLSIVETLRNYFYSIARAKTFEL